MVLSLFTDVTKSILEQNNVLCFTFPNGAVKSIKQLISYYEHRQLILFYYFTLSFSVISNSNKIPLTKADIGNKKKIKMPKKPIIFSNLSNRITSSIVILEYEEIELIKDIIPT